MFEECVGEGEWVARERAQGEALFIPDPIQAKTQANLLFPVKSWFNPLAVTAPERSYCSDLATLRGALWQVWKGGSLRGRLIVRRQLLLYGNGD